MRTRPLLARFVRTRRGTVSVEFVLWLPIFLVIMAFTADACKLYLTQANMYDVARDTARRISIGQYCTSTDAQGYARSQLLYPLTYSYAITVGDDNVVTISTPIKDASVFGLMAEYGGFTDKTLSAVVTMPKEPGACST